MKLHMKRALLNSLTSGWRKKISGKLKTTPNVALEMGSDTIIFSAGDSASIQYLLRPHLELQGLRPTVINPDAVAAQGLIEAGCKTLIISRYLPKKWISELCHFRKLGGRVIYFMDDDLMDSAALVGLPLAYARKIKKLATSQFDVLTGLCDEFWLGSKYLAEKYQEWSPSVLSPRISKAEILNKKAVTICYHCTASHQAELNWLVPVLDGVLAGESDLSLEIFGDHKTNQLYRNLPRAAILHPMSWSNYLAYTRTVRRDIGLAPLLLTDFNKGRGPTKFFDYARMGAVGIYTDVPPYSGFIRHEIDGILLPNDPELWKNTIFRLARDSQFRDRLATAARARAMELVWDAGP